MAQEQVLDQKVAPLPNKLCQYGHEDAEQFEHPGRIADPDDPSFALLQLKQHRSEVSLIHNQLTWHDAVIPPMGMS